jgi:hypothetical protein
MVTRQTSSFKNLFADKTLGPTLFGAFMYEETISHYLEMY